VALRVDGPAREVGLQGGDPLEERRDRLGRQAEVEQGGVAPADAEQAAVVASAAGWRVWALVTPVANWSVVVAFAARAMPT
jgi:hypothetical protein